MSNVCFLFLFHQHKIDLPPFHIYADQLDSHPVADSKHLMSPLPHEAVAFLFKMIVIVTQARHSHQPFDEDVLQFHEKTKGGDACDHPIKDITHFLLHTPNTVSIHDLPLRLHGHPLPMREMVCLAGQIFLLYPRLLVEECLFQKSVDHQIRVSAYWRSKVSVSLGGQAEGTR